MNNVTHIGNIIEESPDREFLSELQEILEKETASYFRARNHAGVPTQLLEPEDLMQLSMDKPVWYNQVIRQSLEIRKSASSKGLSIAIKLLPEEEREDPDAAMSLYNQHLSYVLAERLEITNELSREQQAQLIYKKILREAPYLRASMAKLLDATTSALSRKSIMQSISEAVNEDNPAEEESNVVSLFPKAGSDSPEKKEGEKEEEKSPNEQDILIQELRNVCRDYVDSGNYQDILIQPFSKDNLSIRRLGENVSFPNLCNALKTQVRRYENNCKEILNIHETSFLMLLSAVLSVKHLCRTIDTYERTQKHMSLSFLADQVLEELVCIYDERKSESRVEGNTLANIGINISNISSIVEELQGKGGFTGG